MQGLVLLNPTADPNGTKRDPFTYPEPKWPLFSLEFRPCFGGLTFKNRSHLGSRYNSNYKINHSFMDRQIPGKNSRCGSSNSHQLMTPTNRNPVALRNGTNFYVLQVCKKIPWIRLVKKLPFDRSQKSGLKNKLSAAGNWGGRGVDLSHEKKTGWLGFIGDYTIQLYGDYNN